MSAALATYGEIIAASAKPPHRNHLGSLSVWAAELLRPYARSKVCIDAESLWFARTPRHPRWLLASDSDVAMALNTGTALHAEEVVNRDWVEQAIGRHLTKALEIALTVSPPDDLQVVASSVRRAAMHLAQAGDVDGALTLCRDAYARFSTAAPESVPIEHEPEWLGAHDELCLASIEALLGFRRFLERLADPAAVRSALHDVHARTRADTLLPAHLATPLREHLEQLAAERDIEGSQQTPAWHTTQVLAAVLLKHIASATAALVTEIEGFISRSARKSGRIRAFMAAQAGQRGLELVSKMEPVLDLLGTTAKTLEQLRTTEEESWSDPPVETLASRLYAARDRLGIAIAQLAAAVSAEQDRDDRPDYCGFAYTIAAQECFAAMVRGDDKAFAQLFPEYFRAALAIFGRLSEHTKNFEAEPRILVQAEPLIDLLELSGYAELFSAIQSSRHVDVCHLVWDSYLGAHSSAGDAIKTFAAVSTVKAGAFRTAPRDGIRMNWTTRFDRVLAERGLIFERFGSSFGRDDLAEKRAHAHQLVRALPDDGLSFQLHARDVFAAAYLSARPEADQVSFGRAAEAFGEKLKRSR